MNKAHYVGAPDWDSAKVFDISRAFDAKYEGSTDNPFAGMSVIPGAMVPFQREHMQERLDNLVHSVNAHYWKPPTTVSGQHYIVDLLALRAPTPDELKSLKLTDQLYALVDEAARIRAYLVYFDKRVKDIEHNKLERQRSYHRKRATIDLVAANALKKTMADNKKTAMRHQQRLDDERAYNEYMFAKKELDEMERMAALHQQELDALERRAS